MELRVSTFNLENLFNRYLFLDDPTARYEKQILPVGVAGFNRFGGPAAETTTYLQRDNTARAILDSRPDVLAVQEVEDLRALRAFNEEFLDGYFDRLILLEGNDARGINVGFCVRRGCKANVVGLRTHVDELTPEAADKGWQIDRFFNVETGTIEAKNALFSRDCLEVDVEFGGVSLTFLVNHFKSQSGSKNTSDALRKMQATRVAAIVAEVKQRGRAPILMGDLNQGIEQPPLLAIRDLVSKGVLVDPFADIVNFWTHYYVVAKETSRLDYILVDSSLKGSIQSATVLRKGLTLKCKQYTDDRYPTVGQVGNEASDHCPVTVTLEIAAGVS